MEPQVDENNIEQPKDSFSWKRVGKVVGVVLALAVVMAAVYFLANSRRVKIAWAAYALNRQEYYLACDSLPFYPEVQKAVEQHTDIIDKIKAAGATGVEAEKINCPNVDNTMYFIKGDMLITYQTRSQRQAIEKLIGTNFFGVPWRGQPVK